MTQNKPQFLWFPYMTISRAECTRLSLFLPRLLVLQAARPHVFPGPCTDLARGLPVLDQEEDRAAISAQLKSFQEFALLHGEAGLQSSLVLQWIQQHAPENRFQIASTVKGLQDESVAVDPGRLLMDAALFLEIARELDEKESELQEDFLKMEALEEDFKNILGIEEGETDDALDALNLSIEQEKSHLSVQLPKRMTSWLRLAAPRLEGPMALVTTQREPVDEILDVAQTACAQRGESLEVEEFELAAIPDPVWHSRAGREASTVDPLALSVSGAFHAALEALVHTAHGLEKPDTLVSNLQELGRSLAGRIRELSSEPQAGACTLTLVHIRNCTVGEVWRHWDKEGQEALRIGTGGDGPFPPILVLTSASNI